MTIKIILQNIAILFLFTAIFQMLLRWRKGFLLNRIYLIAAVVSSVVLPFLSFNVFPYTIVVHNVKKSGNLSLPIVDSTSVDWLTIGYMIGFVLSIIYFSYRIIKILLLIKHSDFKQQKDYCLTINQKSTFSFFKHIFLKDNEDSLVLRHEIVHYRRWHSLDILLLEFAKSLLWFNPLVYAILYFARENHEFEADFEAMKHESIDEITMAEYILNYIENRLTDRLLLTNNFFSLTKNRVIMLSKNKKANKYLILLIVPIFLVIFSAFSFKSYPVYETPEGKIVTDTLIPGTILVTDSVAYYDPETRKENIKIVKTAIPMDEYIESLNLSGKLFEVIDTVAYYDPDTKKEFLKVIKIQYPYELRFIFHKLSWEQQDAIIKQYGSSKEVVAED